MKVQSFHTCQGVAYQCAANLLKMTTGNSDVRMENEGAQGDAVQMSIFDMMEAGS